MRIPDPEARTWYMNECANSRWSTRQLERQINTMFRERLLASKDKEAVAQEIQKSAPTHRPKDIIRDPYVLEFLGFSDDTAFRALIINFIRTPPTFIRTCADECGNPIP